jgi:hypothetical protein
VIEVIKWIINRPRRLCPLSQLEFLVSGVTETNAGSAFPPPGGHGVVTLLLSWVATDAKTFLASICPSRVLIGCDGLKVSWVAATLIEAEMIKMKCG